MRRELTGNDRAVLERLQTELARRCDGALDFWTIVCLSPESVAKPVRQGFVENHAEIVRSLAVVLRAILAGLGQADVDPIHGHLDAIEASCRELTIAFTTLQCFPDMRGDQIRTATQLLAQCHSQLFTALRALGVALDCPASYWQCRTPERTAHYQAILDQLFETFSQAKNNAAQPVGV